MRTFKIVAINSILVFALIICTGISKVQASTYLGEFCWGFVYSDSSLSIPPFTAKLAVTDMGNQHFIVNGIDTDNFLFHGNAEIIGSDVHLSLYQSFFGSFGGDSPRSNLRRISRSFIFNFIK